MTVKIYKRINNQNLPSSLELCDLRNILAKTFTNQIWSLKMLIAPQTEAESLAKPGPRALDHEMVGGERRSGRGTVQREGNRGQGGEG
jgi:hypothetical protein